jgi:hypothetical protein
VSVRSTFLVALVALAGCTLAPAPAPTDRPCQPGPEFFAQTIWPSYVDPNQCATSNCHDFATGHGYLRYRPPGALLAPGTPFSAWPSAWQDNYYASIQLFRCDSPTASRLLTVPEMMADPHPPGDSVMDHDTAALYFDEWATATR